MTIHKSKGLEFHTVIFYGLDNPTWWSLTPDRM
ncbi:3'-5' exonuclease [Paraburkholderia tropica]|nr:3'-5' exonuclease [Paraburkholderia tropica]